MNKLKVLELFGGIGACSKALERLGIDYEIADYVEIDKYAVASFNAMHGTNFESQDICTWDKDIEVDLIMHGSPCQDFSVAGKGAGGDKNSGTRSSLMYETIRIVEKLKPKYVIWENVKNLLSKKHKHNFDAYLETMEQLGYKNYYQVLNAKDYGIPQNRERVFTISIRNDIKKDFAFPPKQELKLRLKDMLENEVDEKYYLDSANNKELAEKLNIPITQIEHYFRKDNSFAIPETQIWLKLKEILKIETNEFDESIMTFEEKDGVYEKANRIYGENGLAPTLTQQEEKILVNNGTKKGYDEASDPFIVASRGRNPDNPSDRTAGLPTVQRLEPRLDGCTNTLTSVQKDNYVMCDYRIRKLTPKECWRLMGFDDADFEKAEKVNSNTQLYKQAGNSIVVNVLVAIFKELFNI